MDGGPILASMSTEAKRPSHAERARTLVASASEGTLCTLAREPAGHPFGSHVLYALADGQPVFLISGLAEHTQNLGADARASLLVLERGEGETLALGRVTLLGRCAPVADRAAVEEAFLAQHPSARAYAGFGDFAYHALEVQSARYVGGFGRMSWIDAEAWRGAEPDPLRDAAAGILQHMNDDHADACLAYAQGLGGAPEATAARMVAVDRYGLELAVKGEPRSVRIAFPAPVSSPDEVRKAMVALVREARRALAG
jgi:putative heme iron utilization protein